MNTQEIIDDIRKELLKHYQDNIGWLYPTSEGAGELYEEDFTEQSEDIINGEYGPGMIFSLWSDLAEWHLDYSEKLCIQEGDTDAAARELSKSGHYAYQIVHLSDRVGCCLPVCRYELMKDITLYMAQCLLLGWVERTREIAGVMAKSIDQGVRDAGDRYLFGLIQTGSNESPAAWFALDIACRHFDIHFDEAQANRPAEADAKPYQELVDQWDTADPIAVERAVHILAQLHLDSVMEDRNEKASEFNNSSLWLFPYHILFWLKLRAHKGLKNPEQYTHPMMQTPYVQWLLQLPTPQPDPGELPFIEPHRGTLETIIASCS